MCNVDYWRAKQLTSCAAPTANASTAAPHTTTTQSCVEPPISPHITVTLQLQDNETEKKDVQRFEMALLSNQQNINKFKLSILQRTLLPPQTKLSIYCGNKQIEDLNELKGKNTVEAVANVSLEKFKQCNRGNLAFAKALREYLEWLKVKLSTDKKNTTKHAKIRKTRVTIINRLQKYATHRHEIFDWLDQNQNPTTATVSTPDHDKHLFYLYNINLPIQEITLEEMKNYSIKQCEPTYKSTKPEKAGVWIIPMDTFNGPFNLYIETEKFGYSYILANEQETYRDPSRPHGIGWFSCKKPENGSADQSARDFELHTYLNSQEPNITAEIQIISPNCADKIIKMIPIQVQKIER